MGPPKALLLFFWHLSEKCTCTLIRFKTRRIKMEWGSLGLSGSGCLVDLKVGSELTSAIVCRRHPCSPRSLRRKMRRLFADSASMFDGGGTLTLFCFSSSVLVASIALSACLFP